MQASRLRRPGVLTAHGRRERHGAFVEREANVALGQDDRLALGLRVRARREVELGARRVEADDILSRVGEDLAPEAGEVLADRRHEPVVPVFQPEVPGQEAAVDPRELRVHVLLAVPCHFVREEVVLPAPRVPDPVMLA